MPATSPIEIVKVTGDDAVAATDQLAVEEPLEIRLEWGDDGKRVTKAVSVTMCTPGANVELATGFLYTEGILGAASDIASFLHSAPKQGNTCTVILQPGLTPVVANLERNFYTTSSCGVCGKASIAAVRIACPIPDEPDMLRVAARLLYTLPDVLREQQAVFGATGGLHGCALFELTGNMLLLREDVGRHNALDKLIGAALHAGLLPLSNHVLLLSGRASFELVQKAVMAGIKIIAAVGAPSSLAAEIAEEWGVTLIGFLRGERFNIYSGAERVVI